jgi:hypothetical protein
MSNLEMLPEMLEDTYTSILDAAASNGAPEDFRLIVVSKSCGMTTRVPVDEFLSS